MKVLSASLLILVFFVYIILCSIVYLVVSRKKEKKYRQKVKELKSTFGIEILDQLAMIKNRQEVPYDDLLTIKVKLKEKVYEEVFNETIITFNKAKENRRYTQIYMSKYSKYIDSILSKKIIEEKKSYIAFLLGEYKVDNETINEFLFKCLESNSTHIRFNSLSSISKIGNAECFIKAINIISRNKESLNNKIMLDTIDEFGGDIDKLYDEIIGKFNLLTDESKCMFIDNMASKRNGILSAKLLEMAKNDNIDNEIKSSIIKYFGDIKYNDAKEYLLSVLDEDSWECRALSVKSLENYEGYDIIDKLMQTIRDENWYVRANSARTLLKLDISVENLAAILNGDDTYAREIMQYALSHENN